MIMRCRARWVVATFMVSAYVALGLASALAEPNQQEVRIAIKTRAFQPREVTLRAGQEAVLVFDNQDVEIHAFVPEKLLDRVRVQVDGNGAPQFGERGLKRLLIGGGGQAEIRFVPRTPGEYRYWCDLPGHQMDGFIIVE